MPFQQICRTYQQNIQSTRTQSDATAEPLLASTSQDIFGKNGSTFRTRNHDYVRAAKTGDW